MSTAASPAMPAATSLMTQAAATAIEDGAAGAPTDQISIFVARQALYGPGGYLAQAAAAQAASPTVWPVTPQYAAPPGQLSDFQANIPAWVWALPNSQIFLLDYEGDLSVQDAANQAEWIPYRNNYANALQNEVNAPNIPTYPPAQPTYMIVPDPMTYYKAWIVPLGGPANPSSAGGAEVPAIPTLATLANTFNYPAADAIAAGNIATQAQNQPALGTLEKQPPPGS
jgi:hypothetical protein